MFGLVAVLIVAACIYLELFINVRQYDLERQDKNEEDGHYTMPEFLDMMKMLTILNLNDPGGHNATLAAFDRVYGTDAPQSVLEIGFGLGAFSILLSEKYPATSIVGIDAHEYSVKVARDNLEQYKLEHNNKDINVSFELRSEAALKEEAKSYDVVTTTLVNHHIFPDEAFVDFLKQVARVGKDVFIFNDLYRSSKCIATNEFSLTALRYLPFELLYWISPDVMARYVDLFKLPRLGLSLFIDGGLLSMHKSFSLSEYRAHFLAAGYPEDALQCNTMNKWYETFQSTCRVVCTADLKWAKEKDN